MRSFIILFFSSLIIFVACGQSTTTNKPSKSSSKEFPTNLILSKEINLSTAILKVTKVATALTSPVNSNPPKGQNNYFVVIELVVNYIQQNTRLSSAHFTLISKNGAKYTYPGAYGQLIFDGNVSNFEASPGASKYVYKQGEELKLFFEVPQTETLKNLKLEYIPE